MSDNKKRVEELGAEISRVEKDIRIRQLEQEIVMKRALLTHGEREECSQEVLDGRKDQLLVKVRSEFNRINTITRANVTMDIAVIDSVLWLTFHRAGIEKSLQIPLPSSDSRGLEIIKDNEVMRVVCDFWLEREQTRLNYHNIMESLLCEDVNVIMPAMSSGSPMLHKIVKSLDRDHVTYMVTETQKILNGVVTIMPLYETDMNSWAMNRRIVIIDDVFDDISDPNDKLEYQVQKNMKYYEKFGWTAIGLSDGVLADKNYLLTTDLRKLTPFGQYHNPQRNLYSTLGMKGDELPNIRSKSMQALIEKKIARKGWNLTTAIIDTPLNFEDQILVDNRHRGLSHKITRRFTIFGSRILAKVGEDVKTGDALGFSEDGQPTIMNLRCDKAKITKVRHDVVDLNGDQMKVVVVSVEGERFLRDGSKFSNLHGNKGIIRFMDLGYAVDPRSGDGVEIDVMISAKSVNKRKNFGQILEALANNVSKPLIGELLVKGGIVTRDQINESLKEQKSGAYRERRLIGQILMTKHSIDFHQIKAALDAQKAGNKPIVVEDDVVVEKSKLKAALKAKGLPEDGTSMIHTYFGEAQAITGKMFWGITKDPEDQLWEDKRTELTNNRELRTSGLKFSHVEMKALATRFGRGNPLLKEIMSYSQGVAILQDEISVLKSARGETDPSLPVVDAKDVGYIDTKLGIFHTLDAIKGTVVDDEYMPNGFVLRLPCYFQAIILKESAESYTMGLPQEVRDPETKIEYMYNKIFIPNALSKRCWRHGSGKWGLNTIGMYINHIIACCHKFMETKDVNDENELMRAVARYFQNVAKAMGGKNGDISTYGMAVRYPHSSKAAAALSEDLPANTLEIHRDMARVLKVKTGDVVIAERFPCLGFMSIRPQYVKVTDDPQCKYVIRVSGNSLVSANLDFDGDNLFVASFHSPASIVALRDAMKDEESLCARIIKQMNAKKVPEYRMMTLDDFNICRFPKPTNEEHAELVRKATGVKSHTGPVIALAYNLMRIVERTVPYDRIEEHVHLEVLLDFLGNTVFKQKHGIRSLQEEATDAICTGNVEKMVELGFEKQPSQLLCNLIRSEGAKIGIRNIVDYHQKAKEKGWSKIINLIVRKKNKVYFASRARLGPFGLLDHLLAGPVDLPSYMLRAVLRSEREDIEDTLERIKAEKIKIRNDLTTEKMKDVYAQLSKYIDKIMIKQKEGKYGS